MQKRPLYRSLYFQVLVAIACGVLLGASGQSVYKWEDGKARPRAKHLPAIAALRTLGKKQAAAILAQRR